MPGRVYLHKNAVLDTVSNKRFAVPATYGSENALISTPLPVRLRHELLTVQDNCKLQALTGC